jgi:hypothetical protein
MSSINRTILMAAATALLAVTGARAALAQDLKTPRNFSYEIRDGRRVPKPSNRIVNSDGSWREEIRQGSCVTVKEKSAAGEYKETRRCD